LITHGGLVVDIFGDFPLKSNAGLKIFRFAAENLVFKRTISIRLKKVHTSIQGKGSPDLLVCCQFHPPGFFTGEVDWEYPDNTLILVRNSFNDVGSATKIHACQNRARVPILQKSKFKGVAELRLQLRISGKLASVVIEINRGQQFSGTWPG